MTKQTKIVIFAAVLALAGYVGMDAMLGSARADDAQAAIDARRALMKDIGAQMKAIYAVVDAKSGDMADMQKRAEQVKADAGKLPGLFPAGTSIADFPDKTHAKPEIWQNMDAFKADATKLEEAAGKLAEAAGSGDMAAFSSQFEATGKVCGSCHSDFRAKIN
jgi:cytochrome c556